ncbi:MAG TPA: DUF262 domain-containing HNH endonuclease family protein [Pseudomonadota bacterium]|nr:DUF262 domain-containing HNH endonuclease family protein [Pseudomonadota bacterium]
MAGGTILETNTLNLRDLLSNGKLYEVPPFQRDYSWTEENWEELWLDFLELEKTDRPHYMGTIVLQSQRPDHFQIIDGQQRLATLSLFVIAALRCLRELIGLGADAESNRRREALLRTAFLGAEHPVTLLTHPKLRLNSENHRFYEGTLLALKDPLSLRALPPGERLLFRAMEYFFGKLHERFVIEKKGAELTSFVYERVASQLLFIQIKVQDELSAYTVFETLNARGLELSSADLLKNYFFSMAHTTGQGNLRASQGLWQEIAEKIQAKEIPEFLRHYLNSRMPNVRKERVYKTIRQEITTAQQVFEWLNNLKDAAELVEALEDASHPLWEEPELVSARPHVTHLLLYRVTQYRPLIFAGWRNLPRSEIPNLLRICDVIAFRYGVICQRNSNRLEDVYNRVALALEKKEIASVREVRERLQPIMVPDDEFRDAFAKRAIVADGQQKRLVRYILTAIEKQAHGHDVDFETTPATIEHILPKSREGEWERNFTEEQHERTVDRLGNYLLLETKLNNRRAGNGSFSEKRSVYSESQYIETREFGSAYEDWTPKAIDARQAQLARIATAIWKF